LALDAGTHIDVPLPEMHNAFAYVYEGDASLGPEGATRRIARGELAVLDRKGGAVRIAATDASARLILGGGKPLDEPVAKYGPFVMNTQQQIIEAIDDFRAGRF